MDTADSDPGSGPGGSGEGSPSDDTWGVRGARVRTSVACACSLGLSEYESVLAILFCLQGQPYYWCLDSFLARLLEI